MGACKNLVAEHKLVVSVYHYFYYQKNLFCIFSFQVNFHRTFLSPQNVLVKKAMNYLNK